MCEIITERQAKQSEPVVALVRRAGGNEDSLSERHQAFGVLVTRFQDMAFGCAFGLLGDYGLAEDAAQEAFLLAYQRMGQLRDPAAFPGWLQQIVRSQCHRALRRADFAITSLSEQKQIVSAGDEPEAAALRSLERQQVRVALAQLPETERLVTILFYVRDFSRAEVAQFLGISVVSVKKRLASARARLKERLIDMVQEDLQERRPSNDAVFTTRLMLFTRLFSAFIDAGKSLVRSLADLSAAEDDPLFREVIDDINQHIQDGNSLSGAMARHPAYFDGVYLVAIRRGEFFGTLETALQRLANGYYFENPAFPFTNVSERAFRAAFREAHRRSKGPAGGAHLLLGLLDETDSGAARLLARSGVDVLALRAATVAHLDATTSDLPIYAAAPEMVALQGRLDREAARLGRDRIDTVVLLVALVESIDATEAAFLQNAGLAPERLRVLAQSSPEGDD